MSYLKDLEGLDLSAPCNHETFLNDTLNGDLAGAGATFNTTRASSPSKNKDESWIDARNMPCTAHTPNSHDASPVSPRRQLYATSRPSPAEHVEIHSSSTNLTVAISGSNFRVIAENGRLIIEPLRKNLSEKYDVASSARLRYEQRELLRYQHVKELNPASRLRLTKQNLLRTTVPRFGQKGLLWKLVCPFAYDGLQRFDSYLVPQLRTINIRPRKYESGWMIPETLIIGSTLPVLTNATSKVVKVLHELNDSAEFPGLKADPISATAWFPQSKEHIEKNCQLFCTGEVRVMVCTLDHAADLIALGVGQVWWLNLKAQEELWSKIESFLSEVEDWDGLLPESVEITVCLGREDKTEASKILSWLRDKMPKHYIRGMNEVEEQFPSSIPL